MSIIMYKSKITCLCGGMVDAADSKSAILYECAGSNPARGTR